MLVVTENLLNCSICNLSFIFLFDSLSIFLYAFGLLRSGYRIVRSWRAKNYSLRGARSVFRGRSVWFILCLPQRVGCQTWSGPELELSTAKRTFGQVSFPCLCHMGSLDMWCQICMVKSYIVHWIRETLRLLSCNSWFSLVVCVWATWDAGRRWLWGDEWKGQVCFLFMLMTWCWIWFDLVGSSWWWPDIWLSQLGEGALFCFMLSADPFVTWTNFTDFLHN